MSKSIFVCALIALLTAKTNCQFGFNYYNQQHNNPQRLQAGFQSDFTYPQSDFAFPGSFGFNPRPQQQQRPQYNNNFNNYNNFNQQRPQNNNFAGRPTSAPKYTTTRATPFAVTPQKGGLQDRLNERISQTKCANYSSIVKKKFSFGGLSLGFSEQEIEVNQCDAATGLVVGGVDVGSAADFPHMAGIGYPDFNGEISFKCGGTLISELFVLTAAHCQTADRTRPSLVRLGDLNLKVKEPNSIEIDVPIATFIPHELYNRNTRENDVAVIKMSRAVTLTRFIRPACLQASENLSKPKAIATGWGYTEVGGSTSDILQKVQLDIISNDVCARTYGNDDDYHIYSSQLCAGVLKGGKDTCGGDSGGPLVQTTENECVFKVIGITSYGSQFCGSKNAPGIYTRVSSFLDWIESKVWN